MLPEGFEDYPFSSWESYFKVLFNVLDGSLQIEDFPGYFQALIDDPNINTKIITELLEAGKDPNAGFFQFIDVMFTMKYSEQLVKDAIPVFMNYIESIDISGLFDLNVYSGTLSTYLGGNITDQNQNQKIVGLNNAHKFTGMLIDILYENGFDLTNYIDWSTIPSLDQSEIPESIQELDNLNYDFFIEEFDNQKINMICIKNNSNYLKLL